MQIPKWIITAKNINSSTKQIVDAEEKANGHHVDSQEQKRQLTWTENKVGYCQFAMHGLMECYEIARGLKR